MLYTVHYSVLAGAIPHLELAVAQMHLGADGEQPLRDVRQLPPEGRHGRVGLAGPDGGGDGSPPDYAGHGDTSHQAGPGLVDNNRVSAWLYRRHTTGRINNSGKQLQRGRLAGPVGPQKSNEFARLHL